MGQSKAKSKRNSANQGPQFSDDCFDLEKAEDGGVHATLNEKGKAVSAALHQAAGSSEADEATAAPASEDSADSE